MSCKFRLNFKISHAVIQPVLKFNASRKARPLSVPGVGDFKGEGERLASSAPSPLKRKRRHDLNSIGRILHREILNLLQDEILFCKLLQNFMI